MIKNILKILIKLTLIIVGTIGIMMTASEKTFMGDGVTFMFFTIQSNITIIIMSLIFLIDNILFLFRKKSFINQVLLLLKYTFTIAITITFLVFFVILAPTVSTSYLFSFKNFSVHAIVPVLAITDFFLFDKDIKLTKVNCLLGCAMPLYYLAFVFIGVPLGFNYGGRLYVPYFFLDYKKYGWFSLENGIGVFYWIMILLVAITAMCYIYYFLMKLRQGKKKS